MRKILQRDAPVLREIAKDVPVEKIGTKEINRILEEMKQALDSQDDGVAIAAPQIGYSLRIFVVSGKVHDLVKESKKQKTKEDAEDEKITDFTSSSPNLVFINPVIKKLSKEKSSVEEGCLSVRYLYGKVVRSKKATVEAYDENGKKFQRGGVGLLAQIFQHETDHLNGILFIDKAKYLEDIPPSELQKQLKN
jgi:peptide deformylase